MDDLFGQIDYRSKSDAIVMRLLRSAMDKAHENVQSMNGPMEFLHERSKFYELAAILVEGGLNIVQEEADIHETSRETILSDLMEIKDWLQRRNEEMRLLIIEKDQELLERIENELKLRQALELNERELVYFREKEELERSKSEGIPEFLENSPRFHDEAKGGDIFALKDSVDQQVWNIKQKLQDETRSIKNRMRKSTSNVSDSELYSKLSALSVEDDSLNWDDHFSGVMSLCRTLNPGKYNIMIRQMSSDIDILKGTFDIAFGRMQNVEVLPLEKRWRMIVERDTILVSIKGFINDVQKILDAEFKKRNHYIPSGFCREKWAELMDEMTALSEELKALCTRNKVQDGRCMTSSECSSPSPDMRRTTSEPLPQVPFKPSEEEKSEAGGSHLVARMIKNHESIIQKHRKQWTWLTKEMLGRKECMSGKRDQEPDELGGRIQNAISKLDNIIEWNNKLGNENEAFDAANSQETSTGIPEMAGFKKMDDLYGTYASAEICQLKEDKDCLNLQILLMKEIYLILFEDFMKNLKVELSKYGELEKASSSEMLLQYLDYTIREDVYAVYMQAITKEWNKDVECRDEECLLQEEIYKIVLNESLKCIESSGNLSISQGESEGSETFPDSVESLVREDVYAVYMRGITEEWNGCLECRDEECLLQEEVYKIVLNESLKCIESSGNLSISQGEIEGSETFPDSVECLVREDVYMAYFKEMFNAWKTERGDYDNEMIIREDIYQFLMVEVVKEADVITRESQTFDQIHVSNDFPFLVDHVSNDFPFLVNIDLHRDNSLIESLDSILDEYEEEGGLMVKETSPRNEQKAPNDAISPSEYARNEHSPRHWLLTDGEKLENVLHEVHTSKALLLMLDMENNLEMQQDHQQKDDDSSQLQIVSAVPERQNSCGLEEDELIQLNQALVPLIGFQQVLVDFEHMMNSNLESKSLRIEELKQQIEGLAQPVASIRKRKQLYKKAFINRCQNLLLAENEVDMLGAQVDKLVCLLQRIYLIMNQNSTLLSPYFGVFDILNLIKKELAEGAA